MSLTNKEKIHPLKQNNAFILMNKNENEEVANN